MGNTDSCPGKSPMCRRALCWSSGAPADDDGEWFGDLPRDKGKRKKKRSSRGGSRSVSKMPAVPEEGSICSETIEASEANGTSPGAATSETASGCDVDAPRDGAPWDPREGARSVPRPKSMSGRIEGSDGSPPREPRVKLTFVNGQFFDGSTDAGRRAIESAASGTASTYVGGISTSIEYGHCGILPAPPPSPEKVSGRSRPFTQSMQPKRESTGDYDASDAGSASSGASFGSFSSFGSTAGSERSHSAEMKNSVTSMVALGDGYLLTASESDRAIKMWRVEPDGKGEPNVRFVRDFVGHQVGITSLARVDDKGRFLSASKERRVKLWDSRFGCDDGGLESGSERVMLATFDDMDRRSIRDMVVTEEGSYVRPTDKVDMAMAAAMTKKAMLQGSASVQRAAQERHIIGCTCEFATISGRHREAKVWSVTQVDQDGAPPMEGDVAEAKLVGQLKHDNVVTSIAAAPRRGMIVCGDRMGIVTLWHATKNVFMPGAARAWTSVRTFSWKSTTAASSLQSVDENLDMAITSLSFLRGDRMFVSGSKAGNVRVWEVDGTKTQGETVKKEVICITAAHSMPVTRVLPGPSVDDGTKDGSGLLPFTTASEDGKVLSIAVPDAARKRRGGPVCFNVVNHGAALRYVAGAPKVAVTALACLPGGTLVTGTVGGDLNVLEAPGAPKGGKENDAMRVYLRSAEEESLTLHSIGRRLRDGGVESRSRKLKLLTYKDCFLGSDLVTYLVDNGHAATRRDAIDLGQVLATHLSLFRCVTKKCKRDVEDSAKCFYRFTADRCLLDDAVMHSAPNLGA